MTLARHSVALMLILFATVNARADLILNSSFENPQVTAGQFLTFGTGSTAITGWTVVGSDVAIISGSFASGSITFNAQQGAQWLDLSGFASNNSNNGVSQDVATNIGQDYLLSFHVGSTTDNANFFPATVDLSINNGARTSFTNPTAPTDHMDWKQFSVQFTATSASTNVTFFFNNNVPTASSGLDSVSMNAITAVPEPGSGSLVFLGMTALCWVRRRK